MIIYEEILRDFQKQKVKYVVIGGIAVNLLGSLRNTNDLDILVEMSDENLAKVVKILRRHGYTVKRPIDPLAIADEKTRKNLIKNKHMKAVNFYKDEGLKEVDIIIDSPVSYQEASKDVIIVKAGKVGLPVMAIDKLIKMKKKAGRAVDRFDVAELTKIKKMMVKK